MDLLDFSCRGLNDPNGQRTSFQFTIIMYRKIIDAVRLHILLIDTMLAFKNEILLFPLKTKSLPTILNNKNAISQ